MNEPQGFLRVWVTTAGGTLPVPGVPVRITDEDGTLLHVLRTSESGLTPTVALPAPPAAESLTPGTKPYSTYQISVDQTGYTPVPLLLVPIFDGITSLQPIPLVPATETSAMAVDDMAPPYLIHPQREEMLYDDIDAPWYGKAQDVQQRRETE